MASQTISNHEALASMMAMPIMVPSSAAPQSSTIPRRAGPVERTVVYEGSSGPRELMEAIVIQATAAVKGLKSTEPAASEQMTEAEKRTLAGDGKGKGRESVAIMSEENSKLLEFWYVCRWY